MPTPIQQWIEDYCEESSGISGGIVMLSDADNGSTRVAAAADMAVKEGTFPAGSFVIKRDQPYGRQQDQLCDRCHGDGERRLSPAWTRFAGIRQGRADFRVPGTHSGG